MGCFDVYCTLCGMPLNEFMLKSYQEESKNKLKLPRPHWLRECTLLLPRSKPKHGFRENSCNVVFENSRTGESYDVIENFGSKEAESHDGLVLHTDCWKYARSVLGRGLTLQDFDLSKRKEFSYYVLPYLNYREVSKYQLQEFDIHKLCKQSSNLYLLYSPLATGPRASKNKLRIRSNILTASKHSFSKPMGKSSAKPTTKAARKSKVKASEQSTVKASEKPLVKPAEKPLVKPAERMRLQSIQVSDRPHKKYMAFVKNLETQKVRKVHFGDTRYQHYKDQTRIKAFTHLDHLDKDRRKRFKQRFAKIIKRKYSAAYFSDKYLW